jgi:hypothetical protein
MLPVRICFTEGVRRSPSAIKNSPNLSKYFYLISADSGRFFASGASANKKNATFVCSYL